MLFWIIFAIVVLVALAIGGWGCYCWSMRDIREDKKETPVGPCEGQNQGKPD
jgi:hypothetical protein